MNKSELKAIFINAKATDAKYIGVSIQTEGSSQPEIIINPNPNFDAKFDYYMEAYDDDLILIAAKGKKDIRITAAGQGNRFEDIECQLLGERGKIYTAERFTGIHVCGTLYTGSRPERCKRRATVGRFYLMRGIWEKRRVCGKISETGNKNCCYWQDSDRLIYQQRRAKGIYDGCERDSCCRRKEDGQNNRRPLPIRRIGACTIRAVMI